MRGRSLEERFWAKVDKRGPDKCWPWIAAIGPKGYGTILGDDGRPVAAHRLSYALNVGALDDPTRVIDHSCHSTTCPGGNTCPHRRCVNPAHLRLLDNLENIALGTSFSAANARKTHCDHGHLLSEDNSYGRHGRRQCKTCARQAAREYSASPATKELRKRRYAAARAAGLSVKEAALARGLVEWDNP